MLLIVIREIKSMQKYTERLTDNLFYLAVYMSQILPL